MSAEGFRISPQQRQVWLQQGKVAASPFHASCVVLIDGSLDVESLHDSIAALVDRHEILRTSYPVLPGLFATASAAIVISQAWNDPLDSLTGLGLVLAGLPVYFWWARRNSATKKEGSKGMRLSAPSERN